MRYALALVISILSVGLASGSHAATQTYSYSGSGNGIVSGEFVTYLGGTFDGSQQAYIYADYEVIVHCRETITELCAGNASSQAGVSLNRQSGDSGLRLTCWEASYNGGCPGGFSSHGASWPIIGTASDYIYFYWMFTFFGDPQNFTWTASVTFGYPDPLVTPIETPLPAALPLLAGILGGGVALGLRRRRYAVPNVPVA